jgi:tRNA pseudouridine38-40 synthase
VRRLRLDLAYDGTDFAGWQWQPGRRTVQSVVEHALSQLDGDLPVRVRGAGRTDSGVHAAGQVADCEVRSDRADDELHHALVRLLPRDVRPKAVRTVSPAFDARRQATSKTYAYTLDLSKWGDPFLARYALHVGRPLDTERVRRALARLPGRRDWSAFAGAGGAATDGVRHLLSAELVERGPERVALVFSGEGFLRHMVRNLVGTILEVERGRIEVEHLDRILASGDRTQAGPTAPPHGLCLERVIHALP